MISATHKIHDRKLRNALVRARKRRALTHVFDAAVPTRLQFEGPLHPNEQSVSPLVEIGPHALSPFVLHLRETSIPSPESLLHEEDLKPIYLNLLAHTTAETPTGVPVDTTQDLVIRTDEIQAQLQEDVLPNADRLFETTRRDHPRSFDVLLPYARKIKLPDHLTLSIQHTFEPVVIPEDLETYFDLPESEDDEVNGVLMESEDELDLDLIEAELEQETFQYPSAPQAQTSWLPFGWKRAIAGFVAISFVFVLPLHAMNLVQELRAAKSDIVSSSTQAVDLLRSGTNAAMIRNVGQAQQAFSHASVRFAQAEHTVEQLGATTQLLLQTIPVTQRSYTSGQSLIAAGQSLSMAAKRLTQGFAEMEKDVNPTPVSRSQILRTYMSAALPHVQDADEFMQHVSLEDLPESYKTQFDEIRTGLPVLISTLKELDTMAMFAESLLGAEGSKRYLLIFQNNTEIRPTGGFMGSFAEIKVRDGVIEHMEIPGGGTYDLQGSLLTHLIAPKPLQLLKARWEFQDANWFPDFPSSARQMIQFYTDAGGPSVDGVIAINATYVTDLLALLGPVEMPEYDRTIDAENFLFEAQKIVEIEYDKTENKPKEFIGDLAPILLDRVIEQSSDRFMEFVDVLGQGLQTRDIQLYFTDDTLEQTALGHGWGGAILQTPKDYLMIVDTNLGGGKTDGVIEQEAKLDVTVGADGSIVNTLTIKRTHHGIKNALFSGVNNVDYLRVYVPKGATLLKATGFSVPDQRLFESPEKDWTLDDDVFYIASTERIHDESGTSITEESGKTVFGNWVQTSPGDSSTVTFVYSLPFTMGSQTHASWTQTVKKIMGMPKTDRYTLLLQKQSGIVDRTTTVNIHLPESIHILWSSFDEKAVFTNTLDGLVAVLLDTSSL